MIALYRFLSNCVRAPPRGYSHLQPHINPSLYLSHIESVREGTSQITRTVARHLYAVESRDDRTIELPPLAVSPAAGQRTEKVSHTAAQGGLTRARPDTIREIRSRSRLPEERPSFDALLVELAGSRLGTRAPDYDHTN